jgi:hypothetical protein
MLVKVLSGWRISTYREDPLQGERSAPGPLIGPLVEAIGSAGDDDAADRPGHLQRRCTSATEDERDDFGCVRRRVGNEQAPGNALESLTDDEKGEGFGLDMMLV